MSSSIKPLQLEDTTNLDRQIATFGATGPVIVMLFCGWTVWNGNFNVVVLGIMILCAVKLVNVFRLRRQITEEIANRRPLQMQVYFARASLGPFADVQASLYDPRRFDPFKQAFQPKWDLFATDWDVQSVIGEPQECLVYVDRDRGKVLAFSTVNGAIFPKPYMLPWKNIDVSALIQSRQAVNIETAD